MDFSYIINECVAHRKELLRYKAFGFDIEAIRTQRARWLAVRRIVTHYGLNEQYKEALENDREYTSLTKMFTAQPCNL